MNAQVMPEEFATAQQENAFLANMEFEAMDTGDLYKQDFRLFVQFYPRAVYCPFRSAQEGRPIHEERDFIKIMVPGDKTCTIDTEVNDIYKLRFRRAYENYKAGRAQTQSGTLLSTWGVLSLAQVADMNALGIQTVEQLALLSDGSVSKMPGLLNLRQKAQEYLEYAKENAITTQMAEQKEALQAELAELRAQLAELKQTKVV